MDYSINVLSVCYVCQVLTKSEISPEYEIRRVGVVYFHASKRMDRHRKTISHYSLCE
jgi:hypothetical protein